MAGAAGVGTGSAAESPAESLVLDPEMSIDDAFGINPDAEGGPEAEKEMKAVFDRQIGELKTEFAAKLQEVTNSQAKPTVDPETAKLADFASKMMADPELRPLLERKMRGESINLNLTPEPDKSKGGEDEVLTTFEQQLQQIENSIATDQRYSDGAKLGMVAQLRGPMKQLVTALTAPLQDKIVALETRLGDQVKPITEQLTAIGNRTADQTLKAGFNAFMGEYEEATDPRIAEKIVPLVRNDPRLNPALQSGDVQSVVRIFKQNLLSELSADLEAIRKEKTDKAEAEKAAAGVEPGSPGFVSLSSGESAPTTVAEAHNRALKQLGLK